MNREVYPKVKLIITQSMKEAKSFDDVKVRPEHIVMSMLTHNDNEGVKVLKKLNVDTNELYGRISEVLRKVDLTPRVSQNSRKTLPFSDETKIIINSLDKECEKLNDNMIDTTHILLSILSKNLPTTEILNEIYEVNYNSFKKMMKEMRDDFSAYGEDEMDQNEPFRKKSKISDTKSKTPVLDNFCRDVSKAVDKGEIDPVVGRSVEIKRLSQILSRRKKNNPILIGEPGVGKTSIVEGLAQLIKDGNAPRTLMGKRIFTLDLASIVAGTKYRGQFEERMKAVLEECKANPDIVLFIDELHTIVGAGNASGSLDASNIFKPALARGEIQIIGATTLDEYRENIEKDGALTRRFQQVLVEEPTLEETKIILMNIKEKYEKHHKVKYTEEAIDECVKLSARYIMERSMPDKAIDVMDEAGASTNVSLEKPDEIKVLEEKKLELIERKKDVVLKQKYEEAAKIRDEEKEVMEDLKNAMDNWSELLEKKTTEVGVELISEVVSMMTGIPLTKISTQESKRLINLDKELMGKVIGQDSAVSKVVKSIKRNRIGIKDKNKPVGSFIFLGPTGVGKCICGDTEITVRNKVTGEIKIINIKNIGELVEKYEKMYFLEGVPEENKLELSQLYEDFTSFLIKLDEKHSVVGNRFEILFIPIIKKLYTEFKETNYILVYEMYKTWYSETGIKDGFTKTDISAETLKSDDYHFNGFIEYYKSFKLYMDDTVKNEILKYTIYDNLNGGITKGEYKFEVLIKTLNFENKSNDEIKLIIDEAGLLLNYENCLVTMFAIGKLNGEVFSVNETDDDFTVLNKHLSDGKTIVLYSAKIEGGKVFYRYSLIEDKPLNKIEEVKKRLKKSDNVLLFDKHELEALKKITKTTKISDYEVLTDDGFVDIEALHETIPYEVYHLKLSDGKELKCADNHIVFYKDGMEEVFVKNLNIGDKILVEQDGVLGESEVIEVTNLGYEEVMYDLELKEGSNRRYYTNGILSHNTMLAKLLAEHVFGDSDSLIRMDMSEYMEKHSVSRLVGSPPGYVGYEQGGQLTEKVRRKPHCVILFDEIEKAHEDVFNLLLQLLDEGQLTDGLGRKVNFKNALIILTSNIGVREVNSFGKGLGFETNTSIINEENRAREIIEKALKKKFRPEFLNRIDDAIVFRGLNEEDIHKIIYLEIENLEKRLLEMNFKLKISKEAVDYLAKQGYDEAYGARPLARAIQRYVEDGIADEILNENLSEGETIKIGFDKQKEEITIKGIKTK